MRNRWLWQWAITNQGWEFQEEALMLEVRLGIENLIIRDFALGFMFEKNWVEKVFSVLIDELSHIWVERTLSYKRE